MKKAAVIINIACVLLFGILSIILAVRARSLPEQEAHTRWNSADVPYAQVSVFYQSGISIDECYQMTFDIGDKVKSKVRDIRGESVAACYCTAPKRLTFSSKSDIGAKTAELESYFTDGDFLLFHPYELLYGTFLNSDAIMHDNAVIDENAAWQLFGSSDVVGEYIFYGETAVYICGVVKIPDTDSAYIFLDKELSPLITGDPALFQVYEIVLPSEVPGDGLSVIKEKLGITDGDMNSSRTVRVVENSNRSSVLNLLNTLANIPNLSVRDDAIILPSWENKARQRDITSAMMLSSIIYVVSVFTVTNIIVLIVLFTKRKIFYKYINEKFLFPQYEKLKGENQHEI
ncbi:MAG: ABC transporter permease [Ruminococcus sp.]|jgi:hypothetical protein|nr:ABC transporter permease [Ruminococcus sp.]